MNSAERLGSEGVSAGAAGGESARGGWLRAVLTSVAVSAAFLGAAPAASAQEFRENVRHPCQEFWMVPRAEILACLRADYAAADAELNRVYQQKLESLNEEGREALRESQRAWLARYDSVLTSYYARPWSNHSIVKVLPSQIRAVRDRTAFLRRQ
jgi:uncharacterized protein YecT (DUF1311 family)